MTYNTYLYSNYWKKKKKEAIRQHGKACIACGSKRIEIHHKTYKKIGNENAKWHLLPLCRKHHQLVHDYATIYKVNYYQATEKLYGKYYSNKNPKKLTWNQMTKFQRERFLCK